LVLVGGFAGLLVVGLVPVLLLPLLAGAPLFGWENAATPTTFVIGKV
jgi:hypothetical protein